MRKHLIVALVASLCVLGASWAAGPPPKTELGLIGEFVQTEGDGNNPWTLNADILFPLGNGHLLVGPAIAIGSVDELNRLGGALEWAIVGSQKSAGNFFIGAAAYYFTKRLDADDFDTQPAGSVASLGGGCSDCGPGPTPAPRLEDSGAVLSEGDTDDYSVVGRAGFKFSVGKGAALKFYAFDTFAGRLKDSTDLGIAAGIVARF